MRYPNLEMKEIPEVIKFIIKQKQEKRENDEENKRLRREMMEKQRK